MKLLNILTFLLITTLCFSQNDTDVKLELTIQKLETSNKQIEALNQEVAKLKEQLKNNKESTITEIKDLKTSRKNLEWWLKILGIPFAGLTVFNLLQLYFFKIPKLVKEVAKKRIEDRLVLEEEKIKDVRLSIIGQDKKGNGIKEQLVNLGFKRDKLSFYDTSNYTTVKTESTDYIFINDIDDTLTVETIKNILATFNTENLKYFYYGPKRLDPDIYKQIKSVASTVDTLQSNLIKSIKV